MNPSQPDFWSARFVPSEQPVLTAARDRRRRRRSRTRWQNRTDLREFKKNDGEHRHQPEVRREPEAAGGRPERAATA